MPRFGQVVSRFGLADIVVPMHSHRESQLVVALQGAATITTAVDEWRLSPCSMLWMAGETSHRITTSVDHASLVLSFPPGLVSRTTGWLDTSGFVHDLAARIGRAPDPERRARLTAVLVDEILEPPPPNARFERVLGLLEREPSARAAAVARTLGMSERSFRRWFRADVGTNFSDWHRRHLVDRAIQKLHRGQSVKAVASELGYTSVSAFITMFKRVTGGTPQAHARRPH